MTDELLPRRVVHSPFVGDLVVRNFHGEDINWPLGGPLIRFQKLCLWWLGRVIWLTCLSSIGYEEAQYSYP